MNPHTNFPIATNLCGREPADARWASYYDGEHFTDLTLSSPETQPFKDDIRGPITPPQEVVPGNAWASEEDWQEMMRIKEKGALRTEHWPIDADYTHPDQQEDSLLQQPIGFWNNVQDAGCQLFTEIVSTGQSPSPVQEKLVQLGAVEDITQALNAYHIEGTGVPEEMDLDPINPVLELAFGIAPAPPPTVTQGTTTTDHVSCFSTPLCVEHHRVMNHDLGTNPPVKPENANNVNQFISSFETSPLETVTSPGQYQPAVIMTEVAGTAEHLKLVAQELSEVETTSLRTQRNTADSPKRESRAGNRQDYRGTLAVEEAAAEQPRLYSSNNLSDPEPPTIFKHEDSNKISARQLALDQEDTFNRSRAPTPAPPAATITGPYETSDSEIEAVDLIPTTPWSPHRHNSPSHSESAKQHPSLDSSLEAPSPPANSTRLAHGSGRTQTPHTSASASTPTRPQIRRESRTEEEYFEVLSQQAAAEAMEDRARGITPRETRSRRGFGGSPVPGNPPLAAARGSLVGVGAGNAGVDRRRRRNSGR